MRVFCRIEAIVSTTGGDVSKRTAKAIADFSRIAITIEPSPLRYPNTPISSTKIPVPLSCHNS